MYCTRVVQYWVVRIVLRHVCECVTDPLLPVLIDWEMSNAARCAVEHRGHAVCTQQLGRCRCRWKGGSRHPQQAVSCQLSAGVGGRASTYIQEHPHTSTYIHVHPLISTYIHVQPRTSTNIHVHPRTSTYIHVHPRTSKYIQVHPSPSTSK